MDKLIQSPIFISLAIGACLIIIVAIAVRLRRPRALDAVLFAKRWKDVERQCRSNATWPLAIMDADKLLDEALKKRHCRGKTMGERLVSAQRSLSDNDSVWFGHKLRNKIAHEETPPLQRKDVQVALRGFRQALKDLGALR